MTNHTMPRLTDEQREEAVKQAERDLRMYTSDSHRYLQAQIALAALTAKTIDFLGIGDDDAEYNGIRHFSFNPKEIIDLYRAAPVPALKPIELPKQEAVHGAFDTEQMTILLTHNAAITACGDAIRAAGYEVKE